MMRRRSLSALFAAALLPVAAQAAGGPLLNLAESHYYLHPSTATRLEAEVLAGQAMLVGMSSQADDDGKCSTDACKTHLVGILRDLGEAYAQLGLHALSLRYFQSALSFDESDAKSNLDIGTELMELGRDGDAKASFAKAVSLSESKDADIELDAGNFHLITNQPDEARAYFETCIKLDPSEKIAQYCAIGLALSKLRDGSDSLIAAVPAEAWPGPLLGYLQGKADEAVLTKALADGADDAEQRERLSEALYYVGEHHLQLGDKTAALRYFRANLNLKVQGMWETQFSARRIEQLHGNDDPRPSMLAPSHAPIG